MEEQNKKKKKKNNNRIIQIILLVIIAAGFLFTGLILKGSSKDNPYAGGGPSGRPGAMGAMSGRGGDGEGVETSTATAVEAFTVSRQTVSQFIKVNGDVVSEISVEIYPDTAGKITEMYVKLGQYVKKGATVAVVDPSVPGRVYKPSPVVSTISGTVTAVNKNIGDKVNLTASIAVIGDLGNLTLVTYIPERYLTYLKTGLNAEVTFSAFPDKVFKARVIQLNPVLDKASRSLETKLEIIDQSPEIRAGMFASMKLVTRESRNALAVPPWSIGEYYGDEVVFVIRGDNTVERRIIKTGLISDNLTEVLEGLEEGEVIASQGISALTDGTKVRAVQPVSQTE
jgi:membrane fusion protein, multidrug efflux system